MDTLVIALGLIGVLGIGLAYWTDTIRLWVAVPLIVSMWFLAGAVQKAEAGTRVNTNTTCCFHHHFGVTQYRTGLTHGLFGDMWRLQQTFYWYTYKPYPPFKHLHDISVRRNQWTGTAWAFDGYRAKSKIVFKTNPARWWIHVEGAFTAMPDVWGINEHNYPDVYMTLYRKTGDVTYTTSCGC